MSVELIKGFLYATLSVLTLSCAYANFDENIGKDLLAEDDIVQMAIGRNFMIRMNELSVEKSEELVAVEGEHLEAQIYAGTESFRSDGNESFVTGEGRVDQIGIQKRLSTGTDIGVSVNSTSFDGVVQGHQFTNTSLSVQQKLLRGMGRQYNKVPIYIAAKRLDLSKELLRQTVIDTIAESRIAYYDALLADANQRVANESYELATQLLNENKRRAELGAIARSELLQAEAEVAARREHLYQSQGLWIMAKNQLKKVMTDEVEGILKWDFKLSNPSSPVKRQVDLDMAYQQALQYRPDYRQAIYQLDINEIEQSRDRNLSLPAVDLYFRMNFQGFSDSYGSSFDESIHDDKPNYSIGLRVTRSLFNKASRSRSLMGKLEGNRLKLTLKQLEQGILLDLHSAVTQIETNWNRLESAQSSRALAEKSLQAEQKRYQRGTSSTFILIRLQTDLANAKIRELVAMNDYRKSLVSFDRQTAELLNVYQIRFE